MLRLAAHSSRVRAFRPPPASRTVVRQPAPLRQRPGCREHIIAAAKNRLKLYELDINASIDLAVADDHEQIQKYFDDYESPESTADEKQMAVWLAIKALSMHIVRKEMVFYPAVKQHVGEQTAAKLKKSSKGFKQQLLELDGMKLSDPGCQDLFQAIMKDAKAQFALEAKEAVPALRRAPGMDLQQLEQLGIDFNWATYSAPSRPHPELPSEPPFDEEQFKAVKHADMKRDLQRYNVELY